MTLFTKIYRFFWFILIISLIFLDRQNVYMVGVALFFLVVLSAIAILRAIEARNQWREFIKEEGLDKEIS